MQEESLETERIIDAVADCLPTMGTADFKAKFLQVVKLTGAGQVTAFAYDSARVECLLCHNFLIQDRRETLAADYLDGWYRDDPLFERTIAMGQNDCAVERLEDLLPCVSSRYLKKFFGIGGFRTKVAVRLSQNSVKMVLNLYFERNRAVRSAPAKNALHGELYRLIGKTLATHFLRLNPPTFSPQLMGLSERERQVCIGMLDGKKAEIIAEEIGVGLSSVVTYRQRAYQKLGISSRGELFSICRSWHTKGAESPNPQSMHTQEMALRLRRSTDGQAVPRGK